VKVNLGIVDEVIDLARIGMTADEIHRYLEYQTRICRGSRRADYAAIRHDIANNGRIASQLGVVRQRVTKRIPTTSINISADIVRQHRLTAS
jgi:hypothetical protein